MLIVNFGPNWKCYTAVAVKLKKETVLSRLQCATVQSCILAYIFRDCVTKMSYAAVFLFPSTSVSFVFTTVKSKTWAGNWTRPLEGWYQTS